MYTTTTPRPRRSVLVAATITALTLTLGTACGDQSGESSEPAPTTSTPITTTPAEGGHEHVEVTAVDFAFRDLPREITAGTRLTLRNTAASELHELVAFRLPDGESRPVADLLRLPESELGSLLGAPQTVLLAPPGGEQIPAVGDGTLSVPGRYLVMCAIPTGVDPAAYLKAAAASGGQKPDVKGGPPHFVSGMFAELNVT